MESLQFEQPLLPLKPYKDPNAQSHGMIHDPWAWNHVEVEAESNLA
jgi:hypothetical protein